MSLYDECPAIQEPKSALSAALPSVNLETIVKVDMTGNSNRGYNLSAKKK